MTGFKDYVHRPLPDRHLRAAALMGLLLAVGGIGLVRLDDAADRAAKEVCGGVREGDWQRVLTETAGRTGTDVSGRAAAECRCLALLASGAGDACVALLEDLLAQPAAAEWAPRPDLSVHLIQTRRDRGQQGAAAALARRATRRHPDDADLFYLELVTRSSVEDEAVVLDELEARVFAMPRAARMRVSLATRHLLRGDPERALTVLGDDPPPDARPPALARWFETRGLAYATAGDLAGVKQTYARWREARADPAELRARYALTLSVANLHDPEHGQLELLRAALDAAASVADPALHEALAIRLILTLVAEGRPEEAIAAYDTWREHFALAGLTRAELERSASHRELDTTPAERRRGNLSFRIPSPPAGATLWLSPEPDASADADYQVIPVPANGRVAAVRSRGIAPQRWVYRDDRGRVLASGTAQPGPGDGREIAVLPGEARASESVELERRPGDGRRRVALLLLDCADWRLAQYLRARDELPVLDALLRSGHRAVLASEPPLTAAALEALVWPRREQPGLVGLVHRMGLELAGLSSIGDNPFEALSWVLPEGRDLFAVLGAGNHAVANLLFSHGGIRAGRHGEVTGPDGIRRRVELAKSVRDLAAEERARWPALVADVPERDAVHLRTIAAEFDSAEALWQEGLVDLMALRIEPLDLLTHAHFAHAVRDGQDDGRGLLFEVYRYLDARLGDVHRHLDADDVFIVMSDHGIRTAMEHSPDALFVATGAGIEPGRAAGQPSLRGVPLLLADLLGVDADWPDTGVAAFARPATEHASN